MAKEPRDPRDRITDPGDPNLRGASAGPNVAGFVAAWMVMAAQVRDEANAAAKADRTGVPAPAPGYLLGQLTCIDKLTNYLAARRHEVIATLSPDEDAPGGYRAEQHLIEELQLATRIGSGAARRDLAEARLLAGPFARSRQDLAAGRISEGHVRTLVFETRYVSDDPTPHPDLLTDDGAPVTPPRSREDKLAAIQARVADLAWTQTTAQFQRTVQLAVCAVDPAGEADRRAAALKARDVTALTDIDGMGVLVDRDDQASVQALLAEITRQAKVLQTERGGTSAARNGDADARIGACRADVLKTLILGDHATGAAPADDAAGDGGAPTDTSTTDTDGAADAAGPAGPVAPAAHPTPGELLQAQGASLEPPVRVLEGHLVIDLPTLQGLVDHPCLLDGTPIPAPVGRDLARTVGAWRRVITDPVTGHLLDYGRRTYLPKPLIRFIHARDGKCTAPYCQRPATRCQMDHRIPFPDGPSNTTNCGDLCDLHHPLKTDGYVWISDGCSDGSMTWHTLWGQEVRTQPRPYLDNPGTYGVRDSAPDDDVGPPDPTGDSDPPSDDKPFPF